MSIYKSRKLPKFDFKIDFGRLRYPAIAIGGVAVIVTTALIAMALMQPDPIDAALYPNPLDLAKGNLNTFLTVTVTNVTDATASNVQVSVEAVAAESLVIYPAMSSIATLEKGAHRTLPPFAVRPNPNAKVYSGSYDLIIKTAINGKEFSKTVTLELKTV